MKLINISAIVLLFIQPGCLVKPDLSSARVIKDGEEILWGQVTARQLFFDYPEWKIEFDDYQVDTAALSDFKSDHQLAVEIFFATWCEDSQREVPRFLKINTLLHYFPEDSIKMYAVDRKKHLANDLCSVRNITKVATFIFYRSGGEIGRIIEYPQSTLENDLKSILELK
jgi:thiol-disulfide isomerase/thioredoxin